MTLYPDVKCKILYQRDYLNLLVKYGLEEPSQGALLDHSDGESARDSEQTTAALFSTRLVG
jgi:hypothetical protein